ncbi:MAG: leucine-rich repeat domain-containing protein [Muribaculaceae bacterium]
MFYTPNAGAEAPLAYEEPADMPGDGSFTMDMIQSWAGEGSNRAAMVIQWNDDDETSALVFGYRWDGDATGADMFRAIVSANPQLYGLIQYTNVSSPTDPNGGYTIDGIGWDIDIEGNIALTDRFGEWYESEGGLFIHPRGYVPGESSSIDYDYDDWVARDKYDRWGAGWYKSYWSYWVKSDQASKFSYSGWGASGRVLTDGCWDGWNFNVGMATHAWKPFEAAPPIPDGYKTDIVNNGLHYVLKNGSTKTVLLAEANEATGTYAGDIVVPTTFVDEGITYTVEGVRVSAFVDSEATTVCLPSSITEIRPLTFKGSKSLQTITFGGENKVKKVGEGAFDGCTSLTTFLLPEGTTSIGDRTYAGTAIASVDIPLEITTIGEEAFKDCCALTEVKVHTVYPLEITDETFGTAANEATLVVPTGYTATYKSATGWSNFANFTEHTIPVNVGDIFPVNGVTYQVTSMDEGALTVMATHCRVSGAESTTTIKTANAGYSGDIVVPEKVVYQGLEFAVTAIDEYAFYYATGLTSITIEAPITSIEKYTFANCTGLESMELSDKITSLGSYLFQNCTSLTSVKLPAGITSLPS